MSRWISCGDDRGTGYDVCINETKKALDYRVFVIPAKAPVLFQVFVVTIKYFFLQ